MIFEEINDFIEQNVIINSKQTLNWIVNMHYCYRIYIIQDLFHKQQSQNMRKREFFTFWRQEF